MIYDALVRIDTAADNALAGTNSYRATFVPQTTWFRWVVFGFFLINILVLSGESLSFSPVSVEIAQAFGVEVLYINMASIIFTIT